MRRREIRRRAIQGSIWIFGSYALQQGMRFGSNVALAHMLFPEAFGMIALANVFVQGLFMLSDLGIRQAVVQHEDGGKRTFLDTAWTIQLARGLLLFAIAAILASPYAAAYGQETLASVVAAMALSTVIDGFSSTKLAALERNIQLSRLAIIELVPRFVGTTVMLVWAWLYPTLWAMVFGTLAGRLCRLVLSFVAVRGPGHRLAWDRDFAGQILRFGQWIFVSSLITFFAGRIDVLLIGKLFPIGVLGVYHMALMLAAIPIQISTRLAHQVLFPVLSEVRRSDRAELAVAFRRARSTLLYLAGLGILAVLVLAPPFFRLLYDERYHAAGHYAQLLCLGAWLNVMQESATRGLLAVGLSWPLPLVNGTRVVFATVGALVGYNIGGIEGFILGMAFGAFASYPIMQYHLSTQQLQTYRQDLVQSAILAGIAAMGIATKFFFMGFVEAPYAELLADAMAAVVALVPLALYVARRALPLFGARTKRS
jgi:O-antigen/teichoic acid export membrane protein